MPLSLKVTLERHLNFDGCGYPIHESRNKDHKDLVVFVEVVPPDTLAKTLQQVGVLCLKDHDFLIVVKDFH